MPRVDVGVALAIRKDAREHSCALSASPFVLKASHSGQVKQRESVIFRAKEAVATDAISRCYALNPDLRNLIGQSKSVLFHENNCTISRK